MDACAIIAFLRDESGADVVEAVLLNEPCFIHALNLCEVYRNCLYRGEPIAKADALLADLAELGLVSREDMDPELWKQAAVLKGEIQNIPYGDCFALALTQRLNGVLYTSDHNDFDRAVATGKHSIKFIR
jgi:PIN domain nuclease of toxin-antitoxin system